MNKQIYYSKPTKQYLNMTKDGGRESSCGDSDHISHL